MNLPAVWYLTLVFYFVLLRPKYFSWPYPFNTVYVHDGSNLRLI